MRDPRGFAATALAIGLAAALGLAWLSRNVERLANRIVGEPLPPPAADAQALHESAFVVDLHADSLLWGRDLVKRSSLGHADFPRLRAGGVALQAFTIVTQVPITINIYGNPPWPDALTLFGLFRAWPAAALRSRLERALFQAAELERAAAADGRVMVVRTAGDLDRLVEARKSDREVLGGLLGIEGAHALDGESENLGRLFDAGIRMVGLAHFFDNEFAGSAHGLSKGGLTDAGRRLLGEMERRRIVLDLAHASAETIAEALATFGGGTLVSHTGIRATCDNPRNLSDDQLRAIAARGGIIGIGFWSTAVCGTSPADVARAIRAAVETIGDEHVALGSDFDGAVATPFDAAGLASLTEALLASGLREESVRRVLGGNALAFYRRTLPSAPAFE